MQECASGVVCVSASMGVAMAGLRAGRGEQGARANLLSLVTKQVAYAAFKARELGYCLQKVCKC